MLIGLIASLLIVLPLPYCWWLFSIAMSGGFLFNKSQFISITNQNSSHRSLVINSLSTTYQTYRPSNNCQLEAFASYVHMILIIIFRNTSTSIFLQYSHVDYVTDLSAHTHTHTHTHTREREREIEIERNKLRRSQISQRFIYIKYYNCNSLNNKMLQNDHLSTLSVLTVYRASTVRKRVNRAGGGANCKTSKTIHVKRTTAK